MKTRQEKNWKEEIRSILKSLTFSLFYMPIQFQRTVKNLDEIMKHIAKSTDLIVEGGSGTTMWPLVDFRKSGYEGPYVRMDLTYSDSSLGRPESYTAESGEILTDFWSYRGNCLRKEDMIPILGKFSPQNPVFFTTHALVGALFDDSNLNYLEKKRHEDRIPIPQAVAVLSDLPYRAQLHNVPAGHGTLVSREYVERELENVDKVPHVELFEGVLILDPKNVKIATHLHLHRFRTFIEESAKRGWQFYLPTEEHDVLYMTRK
jgi:hypothetical protein